MSESFKRAININSLINNAAFHLKAAPKSATFQFHTPLKLLRWEEGQVSIWSMGGSCFFSSCLKATFLIFEKYIWRVLICISDATLKWAVESVRRGLTRLAQYLDRAREVGLPQLRDILDLSYFSAFKNEVGTVYMFLRNNENINQHSWPRNKLSNQHFGLIVEHCELQWKCPFCIHHNWLYPVKCTLFRITLINKCVRIIKITLGGASSAILN